MKILIIEDNKDLQTIYKDLFTQAGYEVLMSDNGLAGITDAVEVLPDIILLDIMTPELDGYDFLSALKNNTSMRPLVIVCSNLSQQADIDRAMESGADAYLKKSDYIGADLVKAVENLYNNRSTKSNQAVE